MARAWRQPLEARLVSMPVCAPLITSWRSTKIKALYKRLTRGGGVHTLNLLRRRYIGILCVGGEWVELNVLGHDDAVGERRITLARVAGRFNIEYTVRRSDALLQMTS